ncbi:hypothetical protein BH10ACI4_BH10ACI4_30750 [soil metagenome]
MASEDEVWSTYEVEISRPLVGIHLERALDLMTDAFVLFDGDWRITYANRRVETLVGEKVEELIGQNHWEIFSDAAGTEIERRYRQAAATGEAQHFEYYFKPLSKWFELHAYPTEFGLAVYFRDVSELRESESQFRQIAEGLPQLVWVTRPDGYHDWYNRRWYEYTGTTPEQCIGTGWNGFFHPADQDLAWRTWKHSLETGEPYRIEYRCRRHDGEFRWFLGSALPLRDRDGQITRWFGTCTDIHDQKVAQEIQQSNNEKLRIALSTARLGAWDLEVATGRLDCTDICKSNFGRKPSDRFTYEDWMESLHPEDRTGVENALRESLANDTTYRSEYRVLWPDGSLHWLLVSGGSLTGATDGLVRMVGVTLDVTERHQAAAALVQNEKLAAVGRLASSIAHEINNPLEAVTNLLYLVEKISKEPEVQDYVATAQQELARASQIVTHTLRFYRQSTRPAAVSMRTVLDSLLALYRGRLMNSGIEIERCYCDGDSMMCYEGELRQVLNNLIANAIDSMRDGSGTGRLHVRACTGRDWKTDRRGVRVIVADTGHGMNRENMARIFEAFFTTKGIGGTGLGLWVSSEIVKKHHGTIQVRSRKGHGTVFAVFLPHQTEAELSSPA